ncbi:hypothetical protein OQA88_1479 [Cercophora sp. LCS_1]
MNSHFGAPKFLWGNVPAIDIVKVGDNEGETFPGPLNLLFAASGDLRNVIESIANIPAGYTGDINVHINDHEITIVARNVIILLIFLTVDDSSIAAEHALHVFYSAFLTKACYDVLQTKVKPLVQDVWSKIQSRPLNAVLGKTWEFGGCKIRVVLTKGAWRALLSLLDLPSNITKKASQTARDAVVSAPTRVDYVDRHLMKQTPPQRVSIKKFRQDGILLPFGASRSDFTIPNPTFFQKPGEWPMMDNSDPRAGWCRKQIQAGYPRPATNDIYGMLHYHITTTFAQFHAKLRANPVSFVFTKVEADTLGHHVGDMKFARIETANIADNFYLGLPMTATVFGRLLQSPTENPHATLIMSFMNAAKEMLYASGMDDHPLIVERNMKLAAQYLPPAPQPGPVEVFRILSACDLVWDFEACFNAFLDHFRLDELSTNAGVEIKEQHTVVEPWPLRFECTAPTPEKKKEFCELLASHHTGVERYVEWQVKRDVVAEDQRMRFPLFALTALIPAVLADYMIISRCNCAGIAPAQSCETCAYWYSYFGSHQVPHQDGCHSSLAVPFMQTLCIDYS